jgi:hypothetical protein
VATSSAVRRPPTCRVSPASDGRASRARWACPPAPKDGGAADVNAHGQVVGFVRPAEPADEPPAARLRATLWEADGTLVQLNDFVPPGSGWILWHATGINDHGQIVGVGFSPDQGSQRAILLIPVAT